MNRSWIVIFAIVMLSCGENKAQTENDSAIKDEKNTPKYIVSLTVETEDDIPECSASNFRQLIYIEESKKFFTCKDKWVEIEISGQKGEQGEKGDTGDYFEDFVVQRIECPESEKRFNNKDITDQDYFIARNLVLEKFNSGDWVLKVERYHFRDGEEFVFPTRIVFDEKSNDILEGELETGFGVISSSYSIDDMQVTYIFNYFPFNNDYKENVKSCVEVSE